MAKGQRPPPRPGWEEIPYQEGHWLDFTDPAGICIRDAEGRLVATDLYITHEDAAKIKREYLKYLAEEAAKAKRDHD